MTPKWKKWITEPNLKRIEAWAEKGLSDIEIAKNMGISSSTYYPWRSLKMPFSKEPSADM